MRPTRWIKEKLLAWLSYNPPFSSSRYVWPCTPAPIVQTIGEEIERPSDVTSSEYPGGVVVGNEPVRVGSAFKIAGSGLPGRATREPEGRLGHFALGLGRRNCGMAFRTDVAANIPFGGRWRFGGPPTLAGDAIGRGVRQLIPGRVLLGGSDKQGSETQPTYMPPPESLKTA